MTAVLRSAGGILSLLEEPEPELQVHALEQLDQLIDHYWVEVAEEITRIETLYEDESFPERSLAAMVASKVFYHLEALDGALKYALGAGDRFDVNEESEFVETLIAKCIDEYIAVRVANDERPAGREAVPVDPRLEDIVERMFQRCFDDGQYKQALGIAVEARRDDKVREAVTESGDVAGMLSYLYGICQEVITSRGFRHRLLRILTELYNGLQVPDYISMCQCLFFLDDARAVASTLDGLIRSTDGDDGGESKALMAYQVAFDLTDNESSSFMNKVLMALPVVVDEADGAAPSASSETAAAAAAAAASSGDGDESAAASSGPSTYAQRMKRLRSIVSGLVSVDGYLHFLFGQNKTDLNILKEMKEKMDARNSVTHNATVMANAIMHCGTTSDKFLRDNLEWLGRATNWAKFTATASIGVIHIGHHKESLKLLEPYLPAAGAAAGGSPYQEGGALYALGLIHSAYGSKTEYLLDALRNCGNNEIVQHGACLGLGLTAMGSDDVALYETLKGVLYQDSAVAGEAAGIAMGLVMLGTANGMALEEMIAYAHDSTHEKTIRGTSLGIALIMYGREEQADVLIEQLQGDKDPLLRYGGMYAVALAYVGTSSNQAIQRLLHVAVSDTNDDVRRAAVIALGFVMCREPQQLPRIVSLLSESYNPFVRYGVCMALGIACAGTGMTEALDLLEPLSRDRVDYVRQGAMIAMAMVLIQASKALEPRAEKARQLFRDTYSARRGDTMTKFGATLAAGIINAGGRNVTISLLSQAGHRKMAAIVGMAMFTQYWFWYPLTHFLGLSFTPTALIGLNKNLEMPKDFTFTCNAKPSLFAYPPAIEIKKKEEKKKVVKTELSITARAKARKKQRAKLAGAGASTSDAVSEMEIDESDKKDKKAAAKDDDGDTEMADAQKNDDEDGDDEAKTEDAEDEDEPDSFELSNPARVTWRQQQHITCSKDQRYSPVKRRLAGFVLLNDSTPDEPEDIFVPKEPTIGVPGVDDDEPPPPEPFEFIE